MSKLTVEGVGTFEVPAGKRLVLALIDEAKIDQLHACGGNARCTTCRVEFVAGEPETMTVAEKSVLAARGLTGIWQLSRIPVNPRAARTLFSATVIVAGEPETMTVAEKSVLAARGLTGIRLSCQIVCD